MISTGFPLISTYIPWHAHVGIHTHVVTHTHTNNTLIKEKERPEVVL